MNLLPINNTPAQLTLPMHPRLIGTLEREKWTISRAIIVTYTLPLLSDHPSAPHARMRTPTCLPDKFTLNGEPHHDMLPIFSSIHVTLGFHRSCRALSHEILGRNKDQPCDVLGHPTNSNNG